MSLSLSKKQIVGSDITEHEIANIGNLTITVTRYLGKHSNEWRTDVNLIAYADHIAFNAEVIREVIVALSKAIAIAEHYTESAND